MGESPLQADSNACAVHWDREGKKPWGQRPLALWLSMKMSPSLFQALGTDSLAGCSQPEPMEWQSYGSSGQVLLPQPAGQPQIGAWPFLFLPSMSFEAGLEE